MNSRLVARRAGIVAVCVLSLVACVGLAWWQWERFESASGTWQNLGYVLQWPLFGLFPAFMFWRLRKLRREHADEEPQPPKLAPEPPPRPAARQDEAGKPDKTDKPAEPEDAEDRALAAYNRYLAELNARYQEKQR